MSSTTPDRWFPLVRRSVRRRLHRARNTARARGAPWSSRPAGPPDFVGVGVQRAGTSWWYQEICAHRSIHPIGGSGKEVHHFDDEWDADDLDEVVERYHQRFRHPDGMICGEWTPRYLHDPWSIPLLHRAAPDARLIAMLRDPIDRFCSGIVHARERGWRITADVVNDAIRRGRYHEQLSGVLRHYPVEQLLVLQYEVCRDDPASQLDRTWQFLGLDPGETASISGGRQPVNASRQPGITLPEHLRATLGDAYRDDLRRLADDFPDLDLSRWPSAGLS